MGDVVALLLAHGADPEGRDAHGRTLLIEAAMHTGPDTVKLGLIAGRMSQEALDEGDANGLLHSTLRICLRPPSGDSTAAPVWRQPQHCKQEGPASR